MESIQRKPLIIIVGETGSGKTSIAIDLAKKFNGEIISADSWAVYKGFDIGTAKPTAAQQAVVKHHLIDVADPLMGFSAAEFKKLSNRVIDEIISKGKLPIIVGGTGLYIDSILYNYSFLPQGDPKRRDQLNIMELTELKELAKNLSIDTTTIDADNKRRLIRLIENGGTKPTRQPIRINTLILGIQKNDTKDLEISIQKRISDMVDNGLENEVRGLSNKYGWDIEPMKGTGYKEFREYIDGSKNLDQIKEDIVRNTLKLAKKQRTWFKRNNSIQWTTNRDEIVDLVTTFLNKF